MDDLREFIEKATELGESCIVEGADWNLEIGGITELATRYDDSKLLVFDKIKGYQAGYRVTANLFASHRRTALALGLPLYLNGIDLVQAWRDKIKGGVQPIPPVKVNSGPIMENVHKGEEVDLFEFPTPKWHEHDGGRYIGTGVMVIQRDPDDGTVNLGTYRVQIHDRNIATIYISPGRHGDIIRKKYFARGKSCPVAVVCGQEPVLWAASSWPIPVAEYDYAGGLKNKPIEVVEGMITGLPVPATAEIVLEGEILPPGTETRTEGPFGEWTGYYASSARPEPAFRVHAVFHRNDPIIMGIPPSMLYSRASMNRHIIRAAMVWDELDRQVPAIKGVWFAEEAAPSMLIISLDQKYPGHAKQAALVAAGCNASSYLVRHIIVVDDDIDPSNMSEVIWALNTRCDPEASIDILRGCWGSPLDPILSPEKRERNNFIHSKTIILACRPFYWKDDFPKPCKFNKEALKKIEKKWLHLFD